MFKLRVSSIVLAGVLATFSANSKIFIPVLNDLQEDWVEINNDGAKVATSARMAAASYNDRELVQKYSRPIRKQVGNVEKEKLIQDGYSVYNFSADISGYGKTPSGIIAVKENEVYVAFHGTECVADALTDLNPFGFQKRYNQIKSSLLPLLNSIVDVHGLSVANANITVTGHSLGGALATLAVEDIKKAFINSTVNLTTFNAPRAVSSARAKKIEKLLGHSHTKRIWRESDPVSMLWPGLGGALSKHVGEDYKLPSISDAVSMKNHGLKHTIAEAKSTKTIMPKQHTGFWSRVKKKAASWWRW